MIVCWVDPGDMTGVALLDGSLFTAAEYPFAGACAAIEKTCARYGPRLSLGWESYIIWQNRPQVNAGDALGIIGIARYLTAKYHCKTLPPAAPQSPTAADQQRLRALGWWTPGLDDAQSASAHLLRWGLKTNSLPGPVIQRLASLRGA